MNLMMSYVYVEGSTKYVYIFCGISYGSRHSKIKCNNLLLFLEKVNGVKYIMLIFFYRVVHSILVYVTDVHYKYLYFFHITFFFSYVIVRHHAHQGIRQEPPCTIYITLYNLQFYFSIRFMSSLIFSTRLPSAHIRISYCKHTYYYNIIIQYICVGT